MKTERDIDRLLTISCNLHTEDEEECLSIECRIIEHGNRLYPSIVNLRHDALIRRALGDNDPNLPHDILDAGRLALQDGDWNVWLLAMLHLEDLGYAYWTGRDWSLHLPERTT